MRYRSSRLLKPTACVWFCLSLTACANTLRTATDEFRSGSYSEALATLEKTASKVSDRDRLLLYMNKGMILHHLDRYEESNRELLKAVDVMEEFRRVSISEQASTLAVNEWLASYRGEYAERLWVHSYLMMNFLLLNDYEGAAVEARQALKVFSNEPEALEMAVFTRALIALSFESTGLINDAYLEYKQLDKAVADNSSFIDKLYSQAVRLGFTEDAARYRSELLEANLELPGRNDSHGELIIFLSQGDIPRKVASNVFFPPDYRLSWPVYEERSYQPFLSVAVNDDNTPLTYKEIESDFASLARKSLYQRGKTIAVKQALRVGAKRSIVNEVGDNNAAAGGVLEIALFFLEEADTRGWDSLPARLAMLRVPLKAGAHTVSLSANGYTIKTFPAFSIQSGQRVFRHFRIEPYAYESEADPKADPALGVSSETVEPAADEEP